MTIRPGGSDRRDKEDTVKRISMIGAATLAALVLAAAMGIVSASAAVQDGVFISGHESENQAEKPHFEAEKYEATLEGQETLIPANFTFASGYEVRCNSAHFSTKLAAAKQAMELEASYGNCTNLSYGKLTPLGENTAEVLMNGCKYLHFLPNYNPEPTYQANLRFGCPAGKQVEIKVYNAAKTKVVCGLTIVSSPLEVFSGTEMENWGAGSSRSIVVGQHASGIHYVGHNAVCPGGTKEREDGSYSAGTILEGFF